MRTGPGLVAAILACLAVIGCAGPGPAPSAVPSAASAALPPPSVAASPAPSGVAPDAALLDLLPAEVEGREVILEEPAFAEAATDPAFAANVDRAAFFVVVDEADLASGVVAHLRPGVYSDAFFRDWRDSYDEGACGQAGGVAGNAEAELGGRTVHITSCAGGLLVYHAYLPEGDVAVSVISVGESRFGEQLMAGLEP